MKNMYVLLLGTMLVFFGACRGKQFFSGSIQTERGIVLGSLENKINSTGFLEGYFEVPVKVTDTLMTKNKSADSDFFFLTENDIRLRCNETEIRPAIVQPIAIASSNVNRYFISFESDQIPNVNKSKLLLTISNKKVFTDTIKIALTPKATR